MTGKRRAGRLHVKGLHKGCELRGAGRVRLLNHSVSICLRQTTTFGRMMFLREASVGVTTGAKFLASGLPGPTPRKGNRISQHWSCLPATAQYTNVFPFR